MPSETHRVGWLELLRELGRAVGDLLRAELAALGEDLTANVRSLATGLALVAAAATVAFWLLGVLTLAAVEVLALWLPRWGATLIVGGVLLILLAVLGLVARGRFRRLETPAATVRRRLGGHTAWWQERVLGRRAAGDVPDETPDPLDEP